MAELRELRDLLDDPKNQRKDGTSEEDIRQALQALFMHQTLYRDWPLSGKPFSTVLRHRTFFDRYVDAMGCELYVEHAHTGMIAMRPRDVQHGWKENRLRKDQTLILLALRYLYDDGMQKSQMTEQARVETSTDDIVDLVSTGFGIAAPEEKRLLEILDKLKRKGMVRVGTRDKSERLTPITIMPGVRVMVPDAMVQRIIDWLDEGAPDADADFFDHLSKSAEQADPQDADPADDTAVPAAPDPSDPEDPDDPHGLDPDDPDRYADYDSADQAPE